MSVKSQFAPTAGMALIFGVLLPVAALGFELATGMAAEIVFDPIPGWGYATLVAAVPVLNAYIWWHLRRNRPRRPGRLALLAGISTAISLAYVIAFLPIVPMALIGIVFFGLGLLVFAPLTGFIMSLRMGLMLGETRALAGGLALGLVLIVAVESRPAATNLALEWQCQDAPQETRAITLMRTLGSERILIEQADGERSRAHGLIAQYGKLTSGLWFSGDRVANHQPARLLYFRTYGRAAPAHVKAGRFFRDSDEGGAEVGAATLPDLSLVTSEIEGDVRAAENLAYLEWTFTVFNSAKHGQKEARFLLDMPEGAVASRANLWVDGEPREASISAKGEARAAYESIVRQKRDPLLVTANGPDQLLVQAFPVQAGKEMTFRIGMTAPLSIAANGGRSVALPAIAKRNFSVADDLRHHFQVRGLSPALPGAITDADLSTRPRLTAPPIAAPSSLVASLPATERFAALSVRQTIERTAIAAPKSMHILLDGSVGNRPAALALKAALETVPDGLPLGLSIASETSMDIPVATVNDAHRERLIAAIEQTRFIGGQDNVSGLARLVSSDADSILWIHAAQPVGFPVSTRALREALHRVGTPPELIRFQGEAGRRFLLPDESFLTAARHIAPQADRVAGFRALFAEAVRGRPVWQVERKEIPFTPAGASPHVMQLWAASRLNAAVDYEGATAWKRQAWPRA
ncbi:MAG: VIT domain-containing protein [Pacificimonas sp.]